MSNRRKAERESYHDVPETCPKVDAALREAEEAIKAQTGNLREALTDALERALDAEDKVDLLEHEVEELQETINGLTAEIREIQRIAA